MIRDKVSQLDALCRELRESGADGDYRLLPPAAAGEIRAHERRVGRSFPPSFRAFLELANGWRGFMKGLTLVGLRRRETELFFREGIDEKLVAALADLVPEHELRSLSAREKTDTKVLDPRSRTVIGIDGRGSALVFDERTASGAEPSVALVKYIWVQRSWPSFEALLDDAIDAATRALEARRALLAPPPKKGEKKAGAAAVKRARAKAAAAARSAAVPKLRVVEVRPASGRRTAKKSAAATPRKAPPKAGPKAPQKPAKKKR
jgi:hypothetical protein